MFNPETLEYNKNSKQKARQLKTLCECFHDPENFLFELFQKLYRNKIIKTKIF